MAMTFRSPHGDSISITRLRDGSAEQVQFIINSSGKASVTVLPLSDARHLAKSILSITDPEGEVPVKQAPSALDTVNVSGRDIKAAVTDDCSILTVIDYQREWKEANPLLEHLTEDQLVAFGQALEVERRGGIDVREHDSVTAALKYLSSELNDDHWDRAYIINPARLRYRERPKKQRTLKEPS